LKRILSFIMVLVLLLCGSAALGENIGVEAIFAAPDIQVYVGKDGEQEKLDSVWVFYADGSFEQFAKVEDEVLLFSAGTYELLEDADFVYENPGKENGQIIIRREKKRTPQGLEDYRSEHTYDLGTLGFTQLYAPDSERKVAAVFYGVDKQPFTKKDGDTEMLDTWWIYYSDGMFVQFANLEDTIVEFSEGMYQLQEGSSFVYEKTPETDLITIQRTKKYTVDSLAPYESIHEYEFGSFGFARIVAVDE